MMLSSFSLSLSFHFIRSFVPLIPYRVNTTEILVEILGEEGSEGSHNTTERHQALVQHTQGLEGLVRVTASTLATTTVQTHVAVREGIDKLHQTRNHCV